MGKIKVFISSAMEELEYEREMATRVVESLNLQPSVFEGFPVMSKELEDAYLDEVRSCDIFVLILWKTLRPAVVREYEEAVGANKPILIFVKLMREDERRERQLGAFLGKIRKRSRAEATDICIRFYKHYRSLNDLETELKKGIIGEIERKLSESVMVASTRQGLYELGISIAELAHQRLCVMQRTPSLFFEPRGYYEEEARAALTNWIEKATQDRKREFMYLYRADKTREEIAKLGRDQTLIGHIRDTIAEYKHIEEETKGRICFSSLPANYQGPIFGVGDNRFAIWFTSEEGATTAISYTNAKMADGFVKVFLELGSKVATADDLLRELDIE